MHWSFCHISWSYLIIQWWFILRGLCVLLIAIVCCVWPWPWSQDGAWHFSCYSTPALPKPVASWQTYLCTLILLLKYITGLLNEAILHVHGAHYSPSTTCLFISESGFNEPEQVCDVTPSQHSLEGKATPAGSLCPMPTLVLRSKHLPFSILQVR